MFVMSALLFALFFRQRRAEDARAETAAAAPRLGQRRAADRRRAARRQARRVRRAAALVRSDGARDRLRPDSARRRQPGRRPARAHHDDPPPRRARTRHRRSADPRARQPAAQAVDVRRQDLRPRSRARRGDGQPPARDEPRYGDHGIDGIPTPSRRSVCPRCGSRRARAATPRWRATRSSTRPASSRRTSPS